MSLSKIQEDEIRYRNNHIEIIIDYMVDNSIVPPNLYQITRSNFEKLKEDAIKWQTINTQEV